MYSIIIPNFNGKKYLKKCIDSLYAQTFKDFEIIVVDDKSTDESVTFLKQNYPEVNLVIKEKNSGFPSSVNLGIKVARGKFIVLLNNDTETDKGWLEAINGAIKRYPEAGFFASKMLGFSDRSIIDSCGDGMTWAGRSYKIGELEKDGGKYENPKFVFGACAGASVYKRELFDRVGLFDEDFGFYLEDVDWDFRAQLYGYKCLFVPNAKVYHVGSATAGKQSAFSYKMMIKNHFHVIYKNFPTSKIIRNIFKIAHSELRFLGAAFKYHYLKEYLWGIKSAFSQRRLMKSKRAEIQKKLSVDYAYLDKIIDNNFKYNSLRRSFKRVG